MKRKRIIKLSFIVALFTFCFSCSSLKISIDEDTSYQWSDKQNEKEISDLLDHNDQLIVVILKYKKDDNFHISNEVFNCVDGLLICDKKSLGIPCKTFYVSNRTAINIEINNKKIKLPMGFVGKYKYLYVDWAGYKYPNRYYLNFSNHIKNNLDIESGTTVDTKYLETIFNNSKPTVIKKM